MGKWFILIAILALAACSGSSGNAPDTGSMAYPPPVAGSGATVPGSAAPPLTGGMGYQQPGAGMTQSAPNGRDTGSMAYPTPSGGTTRQTQ